MSELLGVMVVSVTVGIAGTWGFWLVWAWWQGIQDVVRRETAAQRRATTLEPSGDLTVRGSSPPVSAADKPLRGLRGSGIHMGVDNRLPVTIQGRHVYPEDLLPYERCGCGRCEQYE